MYTWPEKYIHHWWKRLERVITWKDGVRCGGGEQTGSKSVDMSLYGFLQLFPESAECPFPFLFSLLSIYTHIQTPYQLEYGGHTRSNFTALGPNHISTCNFITVHEHWSAAHTQTHNMAQRATARVVALNVPLPDNGGTHAAPKSYCPWSGKQQIILSNSQSHKIMRGATVLDR